MQRLIRLTAAMTATTTVILMAQTKETILSKLRISIAESQPAGAAGLAEFKRLAKIGNIQSYGFQQADDISSAALGQAAVEFLVRLDQLRDYQPNKDAASLMSGGDKVVYPVTINGQVRSSIVVDKGASGWKAVAFGGPQLIRRFSEARSKVSAQDTATILVNVASLGVYFLGEVRGGQLMLSALADQPDLNLKAGSTEVASKIFAALAPIARSHNGLPR
jgi:hypothetical protein